MGCCAIPRDVFDAGIGEKSPNRVRIRVVEHNTRESVVV
jgi:hypothetical protein